MFPVITNLCLCMNKVRDIVVILDFGSQYTHLIKSNLNRMGIEAEIIAGDETVASWLKNQEVTKLKGIILSGGAVSVDDGTINFDRNWLQLGIPLLGICYGYQLMANCEGGTVHRGMYAEFGRTSITLSSKSDLFSGVVSKIEVWMSHRDVITKLPPGFRITALNNHDDVAAFVDDRLRFYGVQFHPEVSHTVSGLKILENFCVLICGMVKGEAWRAHSFIETSIQNISQRVGKERVVFGLSGGVDSLTMAALLRKSLSKNQLQAIYVDTGLMPDETEGEVIDFCRRQDISLTITKSSKLFFDVLKGVRDPSIKGKKIGRKFIEVFEELAKDQNALFFAQGTIWSDVIESGVTKFSSQIKPHHNVGGLPKKLKFILLEPMRELFKDQVREVASELGLSENIVRKKVFPGPGFAIRVQNEVTKPKVAIVKKATKIIEDVIYNAPIKNEIWMAFAILINVPSLGVKGDHRYENKHALVVRVVESKNSMTAEFSKKVFPYLAEISKKITDELEVGRVVYDITDKPPATIEWQ